MGLTREPKDIDVWHLISTGATCTYLKVYTYVYYMINMDIHVLMFPDLIKINTFRHIKDQNHDSSTPSNFIHKKNNCFYCLLVKSTWFKLIIINICTQIHIEIMYSVYWCEYWSLLCSKCNQHLKPMPCRSVAYTSLYWYFVTYQDCERSFIRVYMYVFYFERNYVTSNTFWQCVCVHGKGEFHWVFRLELKSKVLASNLQVKDEWRVKTTREGEMSYSFISFGTNGPDTS